MTDPFVKLTSSPPDGTLLNDINEKSTVFGLTFSLNDNNRVPTFKSRIELISSGGSRSAVCTVAAIAESIGVSSSKFPAMSNTEPANIEIYV